MEDRKPLVGFFRASSADMQHLQQPLPDRNMQQLQQLQPAQSPAMSLEEWMEATDKSRQRGQEKVEEYRQYETPHSASSMHQQPVFFTAQEPSCSYALPYTTFELQTHDVNQGYPMSFASFFPTFPMQYAVPDSCEQQQAAQCSCDATRLLQQLLQLQPGLVQLVQQLQQQQQLPPSPFHTPGSFPTAPSPPEQHPPACMQEQQQQQQLQQLQHSPSHSIEEEIDHVDNSGVMAPDYPFRFDRDDAREATPPPTKESKRQLTPYHRVRASAAPVPPNRTLQFRERMKPKTHENSSCAHCGTRETSLWRRNARGETECNPCNLFERKNGFPRPLTMCTQKKILSRKRVRKCPK